MVEPDFSQCVVINSRPAALLGRSFHEKGSPLITPEFSMLLQKRLM